MIFRSLIVLMMLVPSQGIAKNTDPEPCNGYTTIDMRVCADIRLLNSRIKLKNEIDSKTYKRWNKLTSSLCNQSYEDYKEGTIWPLMIARCHTELNQVLLEHLGGLGERSR